MNRIESGNTGKSRKGALLRLVVSFGAIGFVLYLYRQQLPDVLDNLLSANPSAFLIGVGVYLAGLIFTAFRLRKVLRVQNIDVSAGNAYYVNLIAMFFNNVLPSSLGGEMVKAYYLYRNSNGNIGVFSAVVMDRLFGMATLSIVGLSAVLFLDSSRVPERVLASLAVCIAITCVLGVILFNNRIVTVLSSLKIPLVPVVFLEKLREIYLAINHYRGHWKVSVFCLILTGGGLFSFALTNYYLAHSLSLDIPLSFFFFFIPVIIFLGLAPSVNGLGVREAAFLFLLAEYTTADKALAFALLSSFFMVIIGLAGGVVYAVRGGLPAASLNKE